MDFNLGEAAGRIRLDIEAFMKTANEPKQQPYDEAEVRAVSDELAKAGFTVDEAIGVPEVDTEQLARDIARLAAEGE